MSDKSHPVARVISIFGGQTAMARRLGCRQSTVWEWQQKGRVPSQKIPVIINAARDLSPPVDLTANDFFLVPSDHSASVA